MALPRRITEDDLQARARDVVDALERGDSFVVVRNGRDIGELTPVSISRRGVSRDEFAQASALIPEIDLELFRRDLDRAVDPYLHDPFERPAPLARRPSVALDAHRAAVHEIVAAHRAVNPRVFGSVSRGEDAVDSDLDLLVDAVEGTTLLDIGAIQHELIEILGCRVQVVTPGALPVRFRAEVVRDAVPV